MKQEWMTYLQRLRLQKRQRKRLGALIAALSVAVTGTVSWKLHGIGTAMVDETLPENPEGQIRLLSAESGTMFETSAVWEATLPDLGGMETGERIAAVAESQIGYEETAWQFVNDDGEEIQRRYTRYGDWYGNPYGEWNTMFTYFCMKYGGIGEDEVPFGSGCWAWTVELEKNDLIIPVSRVSPHRGDIVFLDTDLDGKADRSGIVTGVNDADGERILTVAEGNVNGAVAELAYSIADEHLAGFLYIGTDARDVLPDAEQDGQQHAGTVFSGVTESGITVKALADETAFPAGTVMQVSDVSRDEALEIAADSLPSASEHLDAVAVDISFVDDDGNELEPAADASVQVQIILPDALKLRGTDYSLLHVADSGTVQAVKNASISAEGAEFDAESFSVYVFVGNTPKSLASLTMVNGDTGNNSSSNPYVVHVGDDVDIFMTGGWFYVNGNELNGNEILSKTVEKYNTSVTYTEGSGADQHEVTVTGFRGAYKAMQAADVSVSVPGSADIVYLRVRDSFFLAEGSNATLFKNLEMLDIYSSDNSAGNPYTIYVGDSIDIFLSGTGDFTIDRTDLLSVNSSASNVTVTCDGKQYTGTRKTLTGLQKGNVKISNGVDDIYIRVIERFFVNEPIGGQKDVERLILARNELPSIYRWPNSETNPYIIYVGEQIEVQYQGAYKTNGKFTVSANDDVGDGRHNIIRNGDEVDGSEYRIAKFVGSTPGTCRIVMLKDANKGWDDSNIVESLWVKVVDPIYVKTLLSDKPKDQIREYLPGQRLPDKNGYVQNTEGSVWTTTAYRIRVGDELRLFSNQEGTFSISTADYLDQTGTDGKYTVFRGKAAGKVKITHRNSGGEITDEMWVQVVDTSDYNHSDIEIADGGTYSVSSVSFDAEGHKITTVRTYDAYIDEVNECRLLGENDALIDHFLPDNYEKRGEPGQTQYEITSAYKCLWIKHFDPCLVKRVIFDVDVKLFPKEEYKVDENGNIYDRQTLSGAAETASSVIFDLGQQSIIDAINKCPMANGFDFTARANAALIQLTANKEVVNNLPLKTQQFEFELLNEQYEYKALKIGTVNGNGQITDLIFAPETVFPDLANGDIVEAYELFNHTTFSFIASGSFNVTAFQAEYGSNSNEVGVGGVIDSCVIGAAPTETEQHLYNVLTKYLYPSKAILPDAEGKFNLSNGHYLFRKISPSDVVTTAKNDEDGNIAFDHQLFDKPGVYHLFIREKNTNDPAVKTYDENVYPVTVTVRDDMSIDVDFHTPNHKPPTFINELNTYVLPATGGCGTVPFTIAGIAMISGAAMLLIRKRRKEAG